LDRSTILVEALLVKGMKRLRAREQVREREKRGMHRWMDG
jgi:hypothetical protein